LRIPDNTLLEGKKLSKELRKIKELYKSLLKERDQFFPKSGEKLNASTKQGVYIISNGNGTILHVGKTARAKGGIKQRLNNHLHAQSSFTIKYLGGDGSKLRGKCKYKYIEVANPRLRALLEAYAISNLCPKHLGLGTE
jgi:excinuclease UvrABC nuclease subunit